ncbi:ribonuclease HII [Nitzschia inconspicua]|uniref:Ribonuclease HII n=1 Tax=Nitzschia inconspicua TaxID=303405 RepID=A0A9K3LXM4_9STRA|nr:ribonuclease HII [Nitzschia inconspicua]
MMTAREATTPTELSPESEERSAVTLATTSDSTNTCHVLPCNIDCTGMAPSHLYFHPVPLNEPKGMYASTFRGRGLLSKAPCDNNNKNETNAQPVLLHVDHDEIKVKAKIDTILEWHHEHNPTTLQYDDQPSRWQRAQAWVELSTALHDPLPLVKLSDDQSATIP